jgi:hypothetical protein
MILDLTNASIRMRKYMLNDFHDYITRVIGKISEEELENMILSMSKVYMYKDIKKGDYDFFIKYLKKEHGFTQCIWRYDNGKLLLEKLLRVFDLNDINDEKLFEHIQENASCKLFKVSDWKLKKENIISKDSNKEISIYSAKYEYRNNWGYKYGKEIYQIIYNDNKIIWIGCAHEKPRYFIIQKEKVYGLEYSHKNLILIKNLESAYKKIWFDKIDDIIPQYMDRSLYTIDTDKSFYTTSILFDLTDHFYKGFFYKGMLFDRNWKGDISKLKSVTFKNELLKIEIENSTYPHCGFILLDLGSCKIAKVE